ncbi:MAG TPA: AraC family ligand binding domain-containing protein, partial [Roseimicrobium sp.]|nr:AraC family ligand binding domain-containing protein [Roseimicrobium sp.]
MPRPPAKTTFQRSYYFTPGEQTGPVFYSVLRAGHLTAGPDHNIGRDSYPGHEIIYCLRGHGVAQLHGSTYDVPPGSILWVNCHHPHAYKADLKDPWEVYWLRFDGPMVDRICSLLSAEKRPVFTGFDRRGIEQTFNRVFNLLEKPRPATSAWLHAEVAKMIAYLFQARQSDDPAGALEPEFPVALRKPIESMRLYFHKSWLVEDLAR